jgi:hypothetical protein
MITFQFYSSFAATMLLVVILLNLVLPFVSVSLFSKKDSKSIFTSPSEHDRFLLTKGSNVSFKKARAKREFWLLFLSFMIIIGISRMVEDNASIIAYYSSSTSSSNVDIMF